MQKRRTCTSKKLGCPFVVVVTLSTGDGSGIGDFCWRISRADGLEHGPCSLIDGNYHKLNPRLAELPMAPMAEVAPAAEAAIKKYVMKGRCKLRQIVGMLAEDFPNLVTSEEQVRNVMRKFRTQKPQHSCRALLTELLEEQRRDPDFYVSYLLNDDNELAAVLWITPDQRRLWVSHPDILFHDNTYNLDDQGFKLGNFNGIDEAGRTVDLGVALVLDETAGTYEWQFQTWRAGMHDIPPNVIATDADPAASLAVGAVFPEAFHMWCLWHILQNLMKVLKGKLKGVLPKFLTDFLMVQRTVGKATFLKRFDLLLRKYPDAASYMKGQLGGANVERWGSAFLQTFTCNTRSTSRGEGSNKDYKVGNKRNVNLLEVYGNIKEVQERKKKRRVQYSIVNGLDVAGAVDLATQCLPVYPCLPLCLFPSV